MAEEKIEGHGRYFKKSLLYIYIYIVTSECVL
jgi:hypothetical protein